MIHFINFPQPSNTPFQKLCKLCETVRVLNYTIMSLEEVFSIIQARKDPCSTMTGSQLADLEFLVGAPHKPVKPLETKTIILRSFPGAISLVHNNMKP